MSPSGRAAERPRKAGFLILGLLLSWNRGIGLEKRSSACHNGTVAGSRAEGTDEGQSQSQTNLLIMTDVRRPSDVHQHS